MKKTLQRLQAGLIVLFFIGSTQLTAQEEETRDLGEVVVTGNRFETPVEKSGKVIYKITAEEIAKSANKTVADLLNTIPGIYIDGAFGTPGTNLSYYVRGGKNRHTLILIDGLPVTDPSAIENDYDLRLLDANMIESIEVLKGGASSLYGTGAAAGVINIQLKKSAPKKPQVTIRESVGSFQTFQLNADVQGSADQLTYMVAGGVGVSEGLSAAKDEDPALEFDKDGYYRYNGMSKLNYQFSDAFSLEALMGYEKLESDYDGGAFFDADDQFSIDQRRLGLSPEFKYDQGKLVLKFNYNRITRDFVSPFPSNHKGKNFQADLSNELIINDYIKTIFGIQYQNFRFADAGGTKAVINYDPYANVVFDFPLGLNVSAGARLNNHSEYGNHLVYHINPSFLIDLGGTKIKPFAAYATAFIAPSPYQLFDTGFGLGNQELKPEETKSFEAGLSIYIDDRFTLNGQYFLRDEENAIGWSPITNAYYNEEGTRSIHGLEFDFSGKIQENLSLNADYAIYQFDDAAKFRRVPKVKLGASVQWAFLKNTNVTLRYTHYGDREGFDFGGFSVVKLASYGLVDLSISHQLFDGKLIISGDLNNALDEDYVGVYGFTSRPIHFNLGATVKL